MNSTGGTFLACSGPASTQLLWHPRLTCQRITHQVCQLLRRQALEVESTAAMVVGQLRATWSSRQQQIDARQCGGCGAQAQRLKAQAAQAGRARGGDCMAIQPHIELAIWCAVYDAAWHDVCFPKPARRAAWMAAWACVSGQATLRRRREGRRRQPPSSGWRPGRRPQGWRIILPWP